jgi:hypothetical protein
MLPPSTCGLNGTRKMLSVSIFIYSECQNAAFATKLSNKM